MDDLAFARSELVRLEALQVRQRARLAANPGSVAMQDAVAHTDVRIREERAAIAFLESGSSSAPACR